jgi:hypothetical protein
MPRGFVAAATFLLNDSQRRISRIRYFAQRYSAGAHFEVSSAMLIPRVGKYLDFCRLLFQAGRLSFLKF